MVKKNLLKSYHETLYHLIQFRISQFNTSRNYLKMDYDSFMICSVTASHFNYQNLKKKKNIDWDESWKLSRSNMDTSALNKNRLSIFSISQILGIPKETVRRKLEKLLKKKILKYSTKAGVIFGEKIDIFKPYAKHEVMMLSTFLKSLNDHGGLEDLLQIKKTDL